MHDVTVMISAQVPRVNWITSMRQIVDKRVSQQSYTSMCRPSLLSATCSAGYPHKHVFPIEGAANQIRSSMSRQPVASYGGTMELRDCVTCKQRTRTEAKNVTRRVVVHCIPRERSPDLSVRSREFKRVINESTHRGIAPSCDGCTIKEH